MNEPPPEPGSAAPPGRHRRRRPSEGAGVAGGLLRLAVAAAFLGGAYLSGRAGVEAARNRLPEPEAVAEGDYSSQEFLAVGQGGDPIYLAETTEDLRRFFTALPTPEERSAADPSGYGIRRLSGTVEMSVVGAEGDAVQVRVSAGAIQGGDYWIHHSQIPGPSAFDPIVPAAPRSAPGVPLPGAFPE